ncbi:phosphotransferase enzyme family protein [Clostridium oryzae]|uniref:Homoserine kinase n=1 Tax=Clostridium oryzae TaxID=1450648 RepID=A0A1V4IVQ0_9CLOT|nr:phosphotransferase [Clostridium oryzae]OPJ64121.1 homoserine kinase [Clostridium oryzae]
MEENRLLSMLTDFYNKKFIKIKLKRKGGCESYYIWSEQKKYFMKIIPSAYMDTAKQSLSILAYLEQKEFPAPRIIQTKNGLLYVEIEDMECKFFVVLYNFIDGREPEEGEDLETIGELVGRLHCLMQKYKGNLQVKGKEFFIDRYINILKKKNYAENKIKIFSEYGDTLWKKVENLPRGFCHGDLHRGNLLKTDSGEYHLLDFDTSCNAFPIYDIMIMCNSTNYFDFDESGYQRSKNTYEFFLKGYTRYCSLSGMELRAFYDLIAVYHYQLQATIIEVYGLDCVNDEFFDKQLKWLMKWQEQCERER